MIGHHHHSLPPPLSSLLGSCGHRKEEQMGSRGDVRFFFCFAHFALLLLRGHVLWNAAKPDILVVYSDGCQLQKNTHTRKEKDEDSGKINFMTIESHVQIAGGYCSIYKINVSRRVWFGDCVQQTTGPFAINGRNDWL